MPRRLNSSVRLALICTSFIRLRCHLLKNTSVVLPNEPLTNTLCPSLNEKSSVDVEFPGGFPQNLTFGKFRDQTGFPFITQDFWADMVDNRRTFFLRQMIKAFLQWTCCENGYGHDHIQLLWSSTTTKINRGQKNCMIKTMSYFWKKITYTKFLRVMQEIFPTKN